MTIKTWNLWKFLPWWKVNEKKTLQDISRHGIAWIAKNVQRKYRSTVAEILDRDIKKLQENSSVLPIHEIGWYIEWTLERIKSTLEWKNTWKQKLTKFKNLLELKYKIFLFWLLKVFKGRWYDIFNKDFEVKNIPNAAWESIYNILRDRGLTTFFMMSKSFWLLEFSDNIINSFSEEKEIKVLETSYDEVISWLEKWWKWVEITQKPESDVEDVYYDDVNLRLDRQNIFGTKRSFRIRKKTYNDGRVEYFYTIKRKKPEKKWKLEKGKVSDMESKKLESRDCYEYEFKILGEKVFRWFLEDIWLRESRSKRKARKKFEISFTYRWKQTHAVLDIDDYKNGIPEFLEIECDNKSAIPHIIRKLWLKHKTLLTSWSRWVFEYYKEKWLLKEEYHKKYSVNEQNWEILWENGEKWNTKIHPVIKKPRKKSIKNK